jgi:hypothetical protein
MLYLTLVGFFFRKLRERERACHQSFPRVVGSQGGLLVTSERIDTTYPSPPPFPAFVRASRAFLSKYYRADRKNKMKQI